MSKVKREDKIGVEQATSRLLEVLTLHVGEEKAIDAGELYSRVYDEKVTNKINHTRAMRKLITALRRKGVPIGSTSAVNGGGYYLCRAGSEVTAFCDRLTRRALTTLGMVAKVKKLSMPELLGQMRMNLTTETQRPQSEQ